MPPQSTIRGETERDAIDLIRRPLIGARQRCEAPRDRDAAYVGVRFEFPSPAEGAVALFDKLGPIPPGMTLDRIDPRGPYSLGNLRYATATMQSLNRSIVLNGWRSRLRKEA